MEFVSYGQVFNAFGEKKKIFPQHSISPPQAFICPKGTIPSFHFSNIPSFQSIVSAAN
jgi:hypothetical protein